MSLIGPVRVTVVALCIALLALTGCAHKNRQLQQSSPEVLYKKAKKALDSYDYAQSIKTYEQLTARFPFTDQARQARLDLIYALSRRRERIRDRRRGYLHPRESDPSAGGLCLVHQGSGGFRETGERHRASVSSGPQPASAEYRPQIIHGLPHRRRAIPQERVRLRFDA